MSIEKSRWVLPPITLVVGVGVAIGGLAAYPSPIALYLALAAVCLIGVGLFFLFLVAAEFLTGGHKDQVADPTVQKPDKPSGKRAA